jgi:hypothetical protein
VLVREERLKICDNNTMPRPIKVVASKAFSLFSSFVGMTKAQCNLLIRILVNR